MIVVKEKNLKDIINALDGYKKILVVGCGGCVTFYNKGGRNETKKLSEKLKEHGFITVEAIIPRQCSIISGRNHIETLIKNCKGIDKELNETDLKDIEAIVSLACGIGVQNMARYINVPVIPANDTMFMGLKNLEENFFEEYCIGCGNCILHITQFCPISRCPKSMLNGPCGGVNNGKCEVLKDRDCIWVTIYKKLKELNKLDALKEIFMPKDFGKKIKRMKI